MKRCTKCGRPKWLFEFCKDKSHKDGLSSQCKDCKKEYQQSEQGKQARNKAQKKHRQKHKNEIAKCKRDHRKTFIGRLRNCFQDINKRCNNPKDKAYKYYGGRGIQNRFESANDLIDHIINDLKIKDINQIKGLEIDRVDNNGHYEKGNIRFVTHRENCNNRRERS